MIAINLAKLKELREESEHSISYVSSFLGYKTPTGYWLIEKGQRKVSVSILFLLAKLYNVSMEDLLIVD